jgi:hypothetical protein
MLCKLSQAGRTAAAVAAGCHICCCCSVCSFPAKVHYNLDLQAAGSGSTQAKTTFKVDPQKHDLTCST